MAERKTTRRKTTRKPATLPAGVLRLDRPENTEHLAQREPLFAIGDTVYTIPVEVPMSVTFEAMDLAAAGRAAEAVRLAFDTCLTPEAIEALESCKTLTQADFEAINKAVTDKVMPPGVASPKAPEPPTATSG